MKFDPIKHIEFEELHGRRSIRLKGYDRTQPGAYFITVVTWQRENLFGDVVKGEMQLNAAGQIVADTWMWVQNHYPYIKLDEFVVMPNHLHGIICIEDHPNVCRGGPRPAPANNLKIKPLGQLVGALKMVSAKRINLLRDAAGIPVWQRDFYDHIIRDENEWSRIRQYILDNPLNWAEDDENPIHNNFGTAEEYKTLVMETIKTRKLPEDVRKYLQDLED